MVETLHLIGDRAIYQFSSYEQEVLLPDANLTGKGIYASMRYPVVGVEVPFTCTIVQAGPPARVLIRHSLARTSNIKSGSYLWTLWASSSPTEASVLVQGKAVVVGTAKSRGYSTGGELEPPENLLMSSSYPAAADLEAWRVVKLENDQLSYASSGDVADAFRILGILNQPIASGSSGRAIIEGLVSNVGWNWDPGLPIFLGLNGQLTQTAPNAGFISQLAVPITATEIAFDIQPPILL